MRARWALPVLILSLTLCEAGCGEGGSGAAAYLLVDRQAREAGLTLRVDGQPVAASLPVEVPDPTTRVELVRGARAVRVDLEGGALLWLRGAQGAGQRLVLGRQVRTDALFVDATDESFVRRFAAALGTSAPVPAEGTGRMWILEGDEALVRSAWMSAPPEVLEAEPVRVAANEAGLPAQAGRSLDLPPLFGGAAEATAPTAPGVTAADPAARPVFGDSGLAAAAVVGLYHAKRFSLWVDAEGGFRWEAPDRCGSITHEGRYRVEDGRIVLDGLETAFVIRPDGSLEHDEMVFARGGDK